MTLLQQVTQQEIINAIDLLLSHPEAIPEKLLLTLWQEIQQLLPEGEQQKIYGADFDLTKQLDFQVKTVKALREVVLTEDNRIREGMTTRDVNELNKASIALTASIMKHHKELINMDRMRAVEEAVLAVVEAWPDVEDKKRFMVALEEGLSVLK